MKLPQVYLASGSPRRSELLTQMGVMFERLAVEVDESRQPQESPMHYVERVAQAKAQAGWQSLGQRPVRPVIGADTAVAVDQTVLGKPTDSEDAKAMLQQLAGREHQVLTAVTVVKGQQQRTAISRNVVTFAAMTESQIDWYIATGEGVDKAGSYAVQGIAAMFISNIVGSYSGIMGLPVRDTMLLLSELGA